MSPAASRRPRKSDAVWQQQVLAALRAGRTWMSCYDLAVQVTGAPRGMQSGRQTQHVREICERLADEELAERRESALWGKPKTLYRARVPRIVCLCGSTRFTETFNAQRIARTVAGEIVLSIEIVTSQSRDADPQHADPELKQQLDELHLRKIDLADYVLVVSDEAGYFGESTAREISYAARQGKPVEFTSATAGIRAAAQGLLS